jgi:hypothetical protein
MGWYLVYALVYLDVSEQLLRVYFGVFRSSSFVIIAWQSNYLDVALVLDSV